MNTKALLVLSFLLSLGLTLLADPPLPPADPSSGGGGGPVGAPIDGGLGILLAMGAAYAGKKYYSYRKEKKAETDKKTEEQPDTE